MKLYRILLAAVAAGTMALTACDEERDFYVYDGLVPIQVNNLYMVGSATPAGWNIDNPTPLTQSADDKYIFEYDSYLNAGELKLCTSKKNWSVKYVRPMEANSPIDENEIVDYRFQYTHEDESGDLKWKVAKPGRYHMRFDLRNWTMSVKYIVLDSDSPIETRTMYMLGDASTAGWSVDKPVELTQNVATPSVFEWTGYLVKGQFRFCTTLGMWTQPFVRPVVSGAEVGKNSGSLPFQYNMESEDWNWKVVEPGIYHISIDVAKWQINTEFINYTAGSAIPATELYMIGSAVPALWDMNNATSFARNEAMPNIFEWEGWLYTGEMKMPIRRKTWEQHFVRPTSGDVQINENSINGGKLLFSRDDEKGDFKWKVTKAGYYRMRVDVDASVWDCEYVDYDYSQPIETAFLYMLGSATPNGDNNSSPTSLTPSQDNSYLFEWTGELKKGKIKFFTTTGTLIQPFIRPAVDNEAIGTAGIENGKFIYAMAPNSGDLMWEVTDEGKYKIAVDLMNHTISVKYVAD